jgi:hypothetical protein
MPAPAHRPSHCAALAAAAVAVLAVAAAGCGASLPTSTESAAADTATAVCGLLREWSNELAGSLNGTSDAITAEDDPASAPDMLRDGYDELIAIADDHRAQVDELDLPATGARDEIVDDLRTGADEAIAELEAHRDELDDLETVEVDDQSGVLGGAFTNLEKAQSVVEPQVGAYVDDTARTAFADEPTCDHVIQPF